MAIGGLTGNAGFSSRSSRSAVSDAIGGGSGDRDNRKRRQKSALAPPQADVRASPKSAVQNVMESILPSGESPGMMLGIMPVLGNAMRRAAQRAGLSVGSSQPGFGSGVGGDDDERRQRRLLGEGEAPPGDMPIEEQADTPETEPTQRTVLGPARVRRRRLTSATFF